MYKNYLKIAWRNILKDKAISLVNIFGLSLGIAVVILIGIYIIHESSYDKWIPGSENTYRIFRYWENTDGKTVWSPSRLAGKLIDEFPEVQTASGLGSEGEVLLSYRGDKLYVEHAAQADSTFFETLRIPFVHGSLETALHQPKSLVISQTLAQRLFGDSDPLNKVVKYNGAEDYQVTGVFDLGSKNSHLKYELYSPFTWYSDSWTGNNRATYVKVKPGADISALEEKITASVNALIIQEFAKNNYEPKPGELPAWKLQPLQEIHLASGSIGWINSSGGNIKYLYIFFAVGLLVLLIAIINYINLSTAQSTNRAKEVGVRKASGARKSQLIHQFLVESLLQSIFSTAVGLILAELLLPFFRNIVDREIHLWNSPEFPLVAGTTFIFSLIVGFLAGLYPAFVLSSFRPARAFNIKSGLNLGTGNIRKILVSAQFTITLTLLIVMAFIYKQLNFMLDYDLGFAPDQVMTITLNDGDSHKKIKNLRNQFLSIPGVGNLTTASRVPGKRLPDWGMNQEGRPEMIYPYVLFTDPHYLDVMDIEMQSGRFLTNHIAGDTLNNFVVNEAFVRKYNLEEPLGTKLKFSSEERYGQIIGVCENFHHLGLHSEIRPIVITGLPHRWYAGIQVAPSDLEQTIASIESLWKTIEPEHPMRIGFLDEEFAKQYDEQKRFSKSILYATLLTLFIALLGLFGLTTFSVHKREKEIGIRKVLGASTWEILYLFSRDFSRLVLIAFVIGVPMGIFFTNRWLQDFAIRIQLDPLTFLIALMVVLVTTIATVSARTFAAARSNPTHSLRSE